MESLNLLEQNVRELLHRYEVQQQTIASLQQDNALQREEMIRVCAELAQLRTDYAHLQTAYALLSNDVSNEERMRVRQRINNLIAQVDRAIEVLKQ